MRTLIILSSEAAIVAAAIALPTVPAMASNQTVTVNFASTTGAANGVGSGFLYGLSQDGTGPDDGLLASLAPTSGRGGEPDSSAEAGSATDTPTETGTSAAPRSPTRPPSTATCQRTASPA